jgi:hypothetical protein
MQYLSVGASWIARSRCMLSSIWILWSVDFPGTCNYGEQIVSSVMPPRTVCRKLKFKYKGCLKLKQSQ